MEPTTQPAKRRRNDTYGGVTGTIDIFVTMLAGNIKSFRINPDDSVRVLKRLITSATRMPPDSQRLIIAGRQLEDRHRISDYGIGRDSMLHLNSRLVGA